MVFSSGEKKAGQKPFLAFRKIYHVLAASLAPIFYWNPPFGWTPEQTRTALLAVLASSFFLFLLVDILRLRDRKFNFLFMRWFSALLRPAERHRFNGATYLTFSFFWVILFFPRPVAVAAMFFLALGDAAAELFGRRFGKRRIFGRSLEGAAACFFISFLVALALLDDWRVACVGALAASLVELFSFHWDDNLTVPLASALALWGAMFFFS